MYQYNKTMPKHSVCVTKKKKKKKQSPNWPNIPDHP